MNTTKKGFLAFLVLALLCTPYASADYNFYLTQGNSNAQERSIQGTSDTFDNEINGLYPTKGTSTEVLVFDANNDGVNEIFTQGINNILVVSQGTSPGAGEEMLIGELVINPVACDVNLDGKLDYIGIFDNGTAYTLAAITITDGGGISVINSLVIPLGSVNVQENLVCDLFHSRTGDTKKYVMWVDNEKYLNEYHTTGSTFAGSRSAVDPGLGYPDSVSEETGLATPYGFGSDNTVLSTSFDTSGRKTLLFVAGNNLYAYYDDGESDLKSFATNLSGSFAAYNPTTTKKYVLLMGDVHDSGASKTSALLYFGGDDVAVVDGGSAPLMLLKQSVDYFGNTDIQITRVVNTGAFCTSGCSAAVNGLFPTFAKIKSTTTGDIIGALIFRTQTGGGSAVCPLFNSIYMSNFTSKVVSHPTSGVCEQVTPVTMHPRIFSVKLDSDNEPDILFMTRNQTSNQEVIGYFSSLTNYSTMVFLKPNPITSNDEIIAPVPVDLNKDGLLDLISSHPGKTNFFMSSPAVSPTAAAYPFAIALNNTDGLTSNVRVTTGFNGTSFVFNYALVCDLSTSTVWNEQFRTGYNATLKDVSANVAPFEDFLTFDSWEITLGGNYSSANILKSYTTGVRDMMEFSVSFTESGNRTLDIISFAADNKFTSYWQVQKNGTTVRVYKVVPFQGSVLMGSTTITGALVQARFSYSPQRDSFTGIKYFDGVNINVNDVLINTTTTAQYDGFDIKDVQLFTEDAGTFTLHTMSLSKTTDVQPSFVQFQNGVSITVSGVTVETPAPSTEIAGEGFTVHTGVNNVFYGVCEYPDAGTYLQRHYIAPTNAVDYTNYEEISVTVSNATSTTTGGINSEGGLANDPIAVAMKDALGDFGFASPGYYLLAALLISFGIAYGGFLVHPVVGGIGFIVGLIFFSVIGWLPTWISVVIFISIAGMIAFFMRRVFAPGDGGG
jgi:hypothetical protein